MTTMISGPSTARGSLSQLVKLANETNSFKGLAIPDNQSSGNQTAVSGPS